MKILPNGDMAFYMEGAIGFLILGFILPGETIGGSLWRRGNSSSSMLQLKYE